MYGLERFHQIQLGWLVLQADITTFDFPYGISRGHIYRCSNHEPFYMNSMHDVWYHQYDEASEISKRIIMDVWKDDHVNADAQDGSLAETKSLNNANFSTPKDGIVVECRCFMDRGPEISR
jgi:hypothetical protein